MKNSSRKRKKVSRWSSSKELGFFDPYASKKSAKVRITAYIDSDVLQYLKKNASLEGEGYQTLLNRILKNYIKEGSSTLRSDAMNLLQGQAEIKNMLGQMAVKQDASFAQQTSSANSSSVNADIDMDNIVNGKPLVKYDA